MTSLSGLFYTRRYRPGPRHAAGDVSAFDFSPTDANSSSSHQNRAAIRRHIPRYGSQNNRRENRHDNGCNLVSRRIHRRRIDYSEYESVHQDEGGSQSPLSSITNSDDLRSIQGHQATGSDISLPGSVLLARERLVERLRGVSVSRNRQTSWSESSTINGNEIKHPSGFDQETLNYLQFEVFNKKNGDETSCTSSECTICLENFQNGDKLIRLCCTHRFHYYCLYPWVRACGACPNCRKSIVLNVRM